MNIRGQGYRIQQFERQFLQNAMNKGLQMTQENILPYNNNNAKQVQSMILSTSKVFKINSNNILPKQENQTTRREAKINKSPRVKYQFKFKLYLFEVLIAYILTICLMLLNRALYFPFFQALMILIIGFSFLPFKVTNFFILVAIPMAIGNYNLGIWILTYPQIIICFISTYLFTKTNPKNLLWVMTTVVYSIIGFIILPSISSSLNSQSKIVVYYIYPLILTVIKIGGGVINHVILEPNIFLHQISLFWMGFSYGLILTLRSSNIQFWYLLVFLTLDIINTRFQFCIRVIKRFFKKEELVSVIESKCSGYAAINSYHLVIFAYVVVYANLNSAKFSYNLISYVDEWYKPLIVWGFFTIYQTISIFRSIKNQKIMIVGYRTNTYYMGFLRALGLSLGLWFFYLGFCIPSSMFSS